jgi:hypothetical protein
MTALRDNEIEIERYPDASEPEFTELSQSTQNCRLRFPKNRLFEASNKSAATRRDGMRPQPGLVHCGTFAASHSQSGNQAT